MIETTISKGYQIKIPKVIREKYNIHEDDKITWECRNDEIILKVKKQRKLSDLTNLVIADEEFDAVEVKKNC